MGITRAAWNVPCPAAGIQELARRHAGTRIVTAPAVRRISTPSLVDSTPKTARYKAVPTTGRSVAGRRRCRTAVGPVAGREGRRVLRVRGWSQAGGQAERGEHRWLLEGGDVDQAAVFEVQYGEHERRERGLAGTAEVPGCARLPVGHDRQQPPLAEGGHAIAERVAHLLTVPFSDL